MLDVGDEAGQGDGFEREEVVFYYMVFTHPVILFFVKPLAGIVRRGL